MEFGVIFKTVNVASMATIKKFEDLEIWQLARQLCQRIYPLTFEEPIVKDFCYRDQLRSNYGYIAEGFGRGSKLEFINSLTTAKGEPEELKSQLYRGIKYLSERLFKEFYEMTDLLVKTIGAFIRYLNKANIRGQKFKERI